ncbi:MAG: BlaI/MecI/CopY family transcriptional regulator [Candidatus Krumholzibacteria bacterium]|nr:BlaI/MecI/CopY family transcriptional regulator [Candidatus Krumholzibacteria bacterium]
MEELLILNALWHERSISTAEASKLTQKPELDIRAALNRLVEQGLVESRGEGKGRAWHLSAAAYRRMGEKASYVRQHGFEPLQQEQMVLQYVEKHGRITRREAADLCQIASLQARNLLSRLAERGELILRGQKKASYYERPSIIMDVSKDQTKKSINHPKNPKDTGSKQQ